MTFNSLKEATVSIQVMNFIVSSFFEATLDIYLVLCSF